MAEIPETVMNFLDDMRTRMLTYRSHEIEELLRFKRADLESRGVSFDGKFYQWDFPFYLRILQEKRFSLDQYEISQYFPLHFAVSAMLGSPCADCYRHDQRLQSPREAHLSGHYAPIPLLRPHDRAPRHFESSIQLSPATISHPRHSAGPLGGAAELA